MFRVLFVCVENSNRSQMAEGFARFLGDSTVIARSAGSRPSGKVNPKAVEAMARLGIDIGGHASESLDAYASEGWDCVVTMGCGDACPHVAAARREDWALPDPRDLEGDGFDAVRDEIGARVRALLSSVGRLSDGLASQE